MCETVCVEERALEPVREGRKEKGKGGAGGQRERKRTGACEEREGGREGASGSEAGLPLKHCSLSFASLRKLSFSSRCLSLLLAASSLAAWP